MAIARPVDRRLFLLLEHARNQVFRQANNGLQKDLGVTAPQGAALFHLQRRDGARMGDLAAALGLNAPAVSGLVDRMAAQGLVTRQREKDDARAARVWLTTEGRRAAAQVGERLRAFNEALAEGFTDEQMEAVYAFLAALARRPALWDSAPASELAPELLATLSGPTGLPSPQSRA